MTSCSCGQCYLQPSLSLSAAMHVLLSLMAILLSPSTEKKHACHFVCKLTLMFMAASSVARYLKT